jgi:tRNA/rRNA methyltransferase
MNVLDNIIVVLVGTLYSGNVGSACRAMANMGIKRLRLAMPRITDDWTEGHRFAVHAGDILESREEFPDFESAVADCTAVIGTTARHGLYRQHVQAPRDLASEILGIASAGPVAIVFGREDKGLLNEEVAQCSHLMRIPVDEGYSSLNLAQAVLIVCYELFSSTGRYVPPHEKSAPAPQSLKMKLDAHWESMLKDIGFMNEKQSLHMMQGIHRVLSRGAKTVDDVSIMMGVARQVLWAHRHGIDPGTPAPVPEIGKLQE